MSTVFLRFPDGEVALATFNVVVAALGSDGADTLTAVPSVVLIGSIRVDVDVVFGTGAIYDAAGNQVPGYHVNLRLPPEAVLPPTLEPWVIHPRTPSCDFGG